MPDYGIKVSLPGYDVLTANYRQLALSTQFPFLLADIVSEFTIGSAGSDIYVDTTHSYGYVPFFLCSYEKDGKGGMLPDIEYGILHILADSTKVRVFRQGSTSNSFKFRLYIFRNKIN